MRHPSHGPDGAIGFSTREAFDEYWGPVKGWVEVDAAAARASELLGRPVEDITALKVDELKAVAAQTGLVIESAKKDDLIAALDEKFGEGEAVNG